MSPRWSFSQNNRGAGLEARRRPSKRRARRRRCCTRRSWPGSRETTSKPIWTRFCFSATDLWTEELFGRRRAEFPYLQKLPACAQGSATKHGPCPMCFGRCLGTGKDRGPRDSFLYGLCFPGLRRFRFEREAVTERSRHKKWEVFWRGSEGW